MRSPFSSSRVTRVCVAAVVLTGCLVGAHAEWKRAATGYVWSFPRDHWPHPSYKNEWWYLTGQLETEETPPRRFGYQFTLFRVGLSTAPAGSGSAWQSGQALMGHSALTDIGAQKHFFSDALTRQTPFLGTFSLSPSSAPIAWMRGPAGSSEPWTVRWEHGGFHVTAQTGDFAFDLVTHPLKPLIFEGPGGLSQKTSDGSSNSLYYSLTRLRTQGQLQYGGRSIRVHGLSWMDKEFGSDELGKDQLGWDWFSLQFDDGEELMLYLMRKADGTLSHAQGTFINVRGEPHYMDAKAFEISVTSHWRNPTGVTYPSGWKINFPKMRLSSIIVSPEVLDQENRGTRVASVHYWEGAVAIRDDTGKNIGQGYVELTGYK